MWRATLPLLLIFFGASCSSSAAPSSPLSSPEDGGVEGAADAPAPIDSGGANESGSSDGNVAADTWANYAAGFFVTYCVSCHNAKDTTGRDYSIQANVAKDKTAMRCGVAATQDPTWNCAASPVAKQFPIGNGPKPSDAERARIVAWITAGEP
jgi:hypothetical protein